MLSDKSSDICLHCTIITSQQKSSCTYKYMTDETRHWISDDVTQAVIKSTYVCHNKVHTKITKK